MQDVATGEKQHSHMGSKDSELNQIHRIDQVQSTVDDRNAGTTGRQSLSCMMNLLSGKVFSLAQIV